jgi:ribosomal protein S18 acetylase RimI-like enzyme
MNDDKVIRVTKADAKTAAVMLAEAFHNYPESVYLMPDEVKRRRQQPRIYHLVVKNWTRSGDVYATSKKMESVAVWYLVDGKEPAWRRGLSLGWWWQSLFMDRENGKRQTAYWEYIHSTRAGVAPAHYLYLMMIGVAPAFQGQGYGGQLLRTMLGQADSSNLPVLLETQLESNIKLYEHFGFKVVNEGIITGTNIKSWVMIREFLKL